MEVVLPTLSTANGCRVFAMGQKCGDVVSNVYPVEWFRGVTVYRYEVRVQVVRGSVPQGDTFDSTRPHVVILSKNSTDDLRKVNHTSICMGCFNYLKSTNAFLDERGEPAQTETFYDGQTILYAVGKKLKENALYEIPPDEVLRSSRHPRKVEFKLKKFTDFSFDLGDLSTIRVADAPALSESVKQFLCVATSHYQLDHLSEFAVFGTRLSYLLNPIANDFKPHEFPVFCEGRYVGIGAHKSAETIETNNGTGLALVVDTAKTVFHSVDYVGNVVATVDQMVLNGIFSEETLEKLTVLLKGIYVGVFYEEPKEATFPDVKYVFRIDSVSRNNARKQKFDFEGQPISVEKYFIQKRNVCLQYPFAPLLVEEKRNQTNYFPLELCVVMDTQRVTAFQQSAQQLARAREVGTVSPDVRFASNEKTLKSLHIDENGFTDWGFRMSSQPLFVSARVLSHPKIVGPGETEFDPFQPPHRPKFVFGANFPKWGIVLLRRNKIEAELDEVRRFVRRFIKRGEHLGLSIPQPEGVEITGNDTARLEWHFKSALEFNVELLFFLQSDAFSLHNAIKNLERVYGIATQDLKISTMRRVLDDKKSDILTNVLAKTNVKLGGINYYVSTPNCALEEGYFSDGTRLFVGMSLSKAPKAGWMPKGTPRFVVGFAANIVSNELSFVGDFIFPAADNATGTIAAADEEIAKSMGAVVARLLEAMELRSGSNGPKAIVIYMNGISDSHYATMLKRKMHLDCVKSELAEHGFMGPLTFIAVHNRHHIRFMHTTAESLRSEEAPAVRNVDPGTVVDTVIVHPTFKSFFLTSHKTSSGSSKVPRYVVLVNESGLTVDQLEEMTYALCFFHQISSLSTSLPTPLYVASLYADRGRRLYTEQFESADRGTLNVANSKLPYCGSVFENRRINA